MLRSSLLTLTLACIPALAQTSPEIQERIAAQQNLIRVLNRDLARYTPQHPQVRESRMLIGILEEQSRLLQQPAERWPAGTVEAQVAAIMKQLNMLRSQIANYRPSHPDLSRVSAIIDLLEVEVRSLERQ
jgi:hypothetical protein